MLTRLEALPSFFTGAVCVDYIGQTISTSIADRAAADEERPSSKLTQFLLL